ncbi:MAG TPA: FAD-binding oxidoreductase [Solirubrobacterales bacterium]|nr:FAD-binding oxidoreductase [Solirubrobacterales bacterium]
MTDLSGLSIAGRVVLPSDYDWDEVRQGQNLAVDMHPEAVAYPESADDVSKVVRFAREQGLKVTGQSTGHGSPALPPLDGTILIKTDRMREVSIESGTHTARVAAGVRAPELGIEAIKHGLCFLPGSSPTVGVTGYTLGGGLGWLARKHGFACNHVRAFEVVNADGQIRQVDSKTNPDLFWALRGGGGGYAIVTALHLELLPIPDVYAGVLIFPAELGAPAIRAYRDWTEKVPEELTSNLRFLRPPPLPTVPEPLRDKPLIVIGVCYIGSESDGEKLIKPIRKIGDRILDTVATIPTNGLSRIAMDPEDPVPSMGHHAVLRELPDEAIEAFVGAAGPDAGSPLLLADLRHAGGALGRPAEGGGALAKLDAAFVMNGIGVPMDPKMAPAIEEGLDRLIDAMKPWVGEGGYFNFADRPCDVSVILPDEICSRLAQVKRSWDPENVILANHSVSVGP